MEFKLFGLTWDFKPALMFMWGMIVLVPVGVLLTGALDDNIGLAMLGFFGYMLWAYITHICK